MKTKFRRSPKSPDFGFDVAPLPTSGDVGQAVMPFFIHSLYTMTIEFSLLEVNYVSACIAID